LTRSRKPSAGNVNGSANRSIVPSGWSGQPTSDGPSGVGTTSSRTGVSSVAGSRAAKRERAGESSISRPADDRPGGAAEEHGGVEETPDGGGDVLEGADVVGRGEQHHQIGALVAEAVEHLADRLADRLTGDGVLREPLGVHAHGA